jgi:hypothetical protein
MNFMEKHKMTGPHSAIGLVLLLITTSLVFGQTRSPSSASVGTAEGPGSCSLSSLPSDIQNRLKGDFGSWKIQEAASLSDNARETWAFKKPPRCPGIAVGLFQNINTPSYVVLLVPVDHPDAGYKFLVFSRKSEQPSYEMAVIEQSDRPGASNYFIRKVPISDFFNAESKRKFQVQARDAILMVDSAEQEYEADLYFWSNGRFRREPVDE